MEPLFTTEDKLNPDFLANFDHLMNCDMTQDNHNSWVSKVYTMATDAQKEQIRDGFLGKARYFLRDTGYKFEVPTVNIPKQSGGAYIDRRIYALMELADSLHDCSDSSLWKVIQTGINAQLPFVNFPVDLDKIPEEHRHKASKFKFKQMTLQDVSSWDMFKKLMTFNSHLKFNCDEEGIPYEDTTKLTEVYNPLCMRDITKDSFVVNDKNTVEDEFYRYLTTPTQTIVAPGNIAESMVGLSFSTASPVNVDTTIRVKGNGIHFADVWSFWGTDNLQVFKLIQLAYLCGKMRETYGKEATFVVDCDEVMVRLVLGMKMTYTSIKWVLDIKKNDTGFISTEDENVQWAMKELSSRTEAETITAELIDSAFDELRKEVDVTWTVRSCDASYMDSAERYAPLHAKDTGEVFHPKSAAQVILSDAVEDGSNMSYKYTVKSTVASIRWGFDGDEETYIVTSHGKDIGRSNNIIWKDQHGRILNHSKSYVMGQIEGKRSSATERDKNPAVVLALKRAGDWGMIKHCKENGLIFVTPDRFAALYATFMEVAVMFLQVRPIDEGTSGKIKFCQYSYSLIVDDASRTKLTFHHDSEQRMPTQEAGGKLSLNHIALAIIPLLVSIAMSITNL